MIKALSVVVFFFLSSVSLVLAQSSAGDIAFVAYSADGNDGFAFVTFVNIADNTTIYFSDDDWDGSMFSTDEGAVTWTNNSGGMIATGTVITISSASSSPVASVGTATESNPGFNIGASNEIIWAFLGPDDNTPTTFLAALATDDYSAGGSVLTGTGLVVDDTAIEMDNKSGATDDDIGVYVGSTICNSTTSVCRQLITDLTNNPANWLTDEGSGDQSQNGVDAEFPSPNGGGTGVPASFSFPALPVELISFQATEADNTIKLDWETATEENNSHFDIQRSENGYSFTNIGTVKGSGDSFESQFYTFLDANPGLGNNYYRLKQVDFDGSFEYHDVVVIKMEEQAKAFKIYPNPALNELTVELSSNDRTNIQIFNMNGQVVFNEVFNDFNVNLNIADLPKGKYILRAVNVAQTITQHFSKIK